MYYRMSTISIIAKNLQKDKIKHFDDALYLPIDEITKQQQSQFIFYMQRTQNLQKLNTDSSKGYKKVLTDGDSLSSIEKKQKSMPKFGRKADVRLLQKKRSSDTLPTEQRVSYLSPGKTIKNQSSILNISGFQGPSLSDVIQKFSISHDDIFKQQKTPMTDRQNNHTYVVKECQSEKCKTALLQKDHKLQCMKEKIQKFKEENLYLKECNEVLKLKLNECESIQVFLLQRQTFISQILENNIKLNQDLLKLQQENKKLEIQCQKLVQETKSLKTEYDSKITKMVEECNTKCQQAQRSINECKENQRKIFPRQNKSPKTLQKLKQNNENVNNVNLKRSPKKSKMKNNEKIDNKTSIKEPKVQLISHDLNISSEKSLHLTIYEQTLLNDSMFQNTPSQNSKENNDPSENTDLSKDDKDLKIIKQLQQKIRYSAIEIDILKKIKHDSQKVTKDNESLKFQNRKLLNRISYLTRTFSKRGRDNSDSSFELSLSPKRQ